MESRFFKAKVSLSLEDIAKITSSEILNDATGNPNIRYSSVAPLDISTPSDITACYDKKIKDSIPYVKAGVCLTTSELAPLFAKEVSVLVAKDARKAFTEIIRTLYPEEKPAPFISSQAFISETAKIGTGVRIEAGAFIGNNAQIGDYCYIAPNAVIGDNVIIGENSSIGSNSSIHYSVLGKHVKIYSGARIGEDGFGFVSGPSGHLKIPQIGLVIIGDDVEVGANSCIDRGALVDTVIGAGTIIDNLVQIGHNNKLGKACVVVAQVGIAGSCTLGDFVALGGQAGVKDHINIGSGTQIAAQSGILQDLPPMQKVMGTPAMPIKDFFKQVVYLKQLLTDRKKPNNE